MQNSNTILIRKIIKRIKDQNFELGKLLEENINNPNKMIEIIYNELLKYMSRESINKAVENLRKAIEMGKIRIEDLL